eukprot:6187805-Pleurochrysis_carterae.AAC.2
MEWGWAAARKAGTPKRTDGKRAAAKNSKSRPLWRLETTRMHVACGSSTAIKALADEQSPR